MKSFYTGLVDIVKRHGGSSVLDFQIAMGPKSASQPSQPTVTGMIHVSRVEASPAPHNWRDPHQRDLLFDDIIAYLGAQGFLVNPHFKIWFSSVELDDLLGQTVENRAARWWVRP